MYSYLKGRVVGIQKLSSTKVMLLLEVNQVGYEVQVVPRLAGELPSTGELTQIWTDLQIREERSVLFGFATMAERDLFRQLISVSGVGPQLGMALLDTLSLPDLVQAIVSSNVRMLARTPGVGAKTAERISLELRTKLAEWRLQAGMSTVPDATPVGSVQEDVEMTLLALGYTSDEIMKALRAVGQQTALAKNADAEVWIREAIAWLSR
ncbi:MAG TPA: Holliday junction branch migration protein RuvA [Chroococcidiopsis sp.]